MVVGCDDFRRRCEVQGDAVRADPAGFPGGGLVGAGVGETPSGAPQNGAAGVGLGDATGTGSPEVGAQGVRPGDRTGPDGGLLPGPGGSTPRDVDGSGPRRALAADRAGVRRP